jgi:predicted transcriptional regulator
MDENNAKSEMLITLTSDIVAAHVSNNSVAVSDLPVLIQNVHAALASLDNPAPLLKQSPSRRFPSVPRSSPITSCALRTARSSRC